MCVYLWEVFWRQNHLDLVVLWMWRASESEARSWLEQRGGWWRHLVRKGRVWEEQVLGRQVPTLEWVWAFMSPPSGCLWEAVAQMDLKLMNKVRAGSKICELPTNVWLLQSRTSWCYSEREGEGERESLGLSPKEFQSLFIWQTFMDSLCQRPV